MELLIIFCPGIIGITLLEVLRKGKFSSFTFLKRTLVLDLFSNLCSVFSYQYIFRGENSVMEYIYDNRFLLIYTCLNLVIGIILVVLYYLAAPHINLSVSQRKTKKVTTHEK